MSKTQNRGIFPDNHSLGLDLIGLFGAMLGIGEGIALMYGAIFGVVSFYPNVLLLVGGSLWTGMFAFLLTAWSFGWLE